MKSKEIREFRKTYTKYEKECVFEGYKLAVLFDEKDDVKRYGGRWNPAPEGEEGGHWWMPKNKLLDEVHDNGTLVRDYLNDSEMIVGQYGKIDSTKFLNECSESDKEPIKYELLHKNAGDDYTAQNTGSFYIWEDIGIAGWANNDSEMQYMTLADGRTMWDDLMKTGYRMIIRENILTSEKENV